MPGRRLRGSETTWRKAAPARPPARWRAVTGRRRYRRETNYAAPHSRTSSCDLRADFPDAGRGAANEEQEAQDRGCDADPDQDLRSLAPDEEELSNQERTGDVTGPL